MAATQGADDVMSFGDSERLDRGPPGPTPVEVGSRHQLAAPGRLVDTTVDHPGVGVREGGVPNAW